MFHKDMDKTLWLTFLGHPVYRPSSVVRLSSVGVYASALVYRPALQNIADPVDVFAYIFRNR